MKKEIVVYRVYDEDMEFYGDEEGIKDWLMETQAHQLNFDEKDLEDKGWNYWLEKAGVDFEEIYSKEII